MHTMIAKKINPAALHALNEALTLAFWFKKDLRAFLGTALPDNELVPQLDWTGYKWNIVHQLVNTLSTTPKYTDDLLTLMISTVEIGDPQHLKRLEDGEKKYREARQALNNLKVKVEPYQKLRDEAEEAERRRREERARAELQQAITKKLEELKSLFYTIVAQDPQERGYSLEKLLNELFALFDIDAKASFRITGEQIDGAFTFEATEYLFEAKWRNIKTSTADLDTFSGKIKRKLENTLGLFLSINGFEGTAIDLHSQNGAVMLLMDGADLSAVLENRIPLPDLLVRKRQHASRTGKIMLGAYSII